MRFFYTMNYYSYSCPPIRLSRYLELTKECRNKFQNSLWGDKLITIFCYCFMPNHFHFLLKQNVDFGISRYIGQLLNSYTRYFNTKNERVGQLFLDQFKNVLVENNNQFVHLSRYIHLNPFSSDILRSVNELSNYNWSSFAEYTGSGANKICDKSIIKSLFKDFDTYKKFVLNNADYQRKLKIIRTLTID